MSPRPFPVSESNYSLHTTSRNLFSFCPRVVLCTKGLQRQVPLWELWGTNYLGSQISMSQIQPTSEPCLSFLSFPPARIIEFKQNAIPYQSRSSSVFPFRVIILRACSIWLRIPTLNFTIHFERELVLVHCSNLKLTMNMSHLVYDILSKNIAAGWMVLWMTHLFQT